MIRIECKVYPGSEKHKSKQQSTWNSSEGLMIAVCLNHVTFGLGVPSSLTINVTSWPSTTVWDSIFWVIFGASAFWPLFNSVNIIKISMYDVSYINVLKKCRCTFLNISSYLIGD